tara:strand:+ start:2344 stop:2691 length:348 start_codon:yes stop_codon:yes gene_type:complete
MSVDSYTETEAERNARLSKVLGHYARAVEGLNARGNYPVDSELANTLHRASKRIAELEAENAALREDAERYRWFRSKSLWDADSFPWPKDFEYPEPCLWDDGEMLDAAIDAARKT